jgi:hypothetical protein
MELTEFRENDTSVMRRVATLSKYDEIAMSLQKTSGQSKVIVFSGDDSLDVLARSDFATTRHVEFLEHLALRLKLDLSATLTVMRHLPLWADGARHQALRQETAAFIGKHRGRKMAQAGLDLQETFKVNMMTDSENVDMLRLVQDMVADLLVQVTGLPKPSAGPQNSLNVFSSNLGIAARLRLESELKYQLDQAGSLYPDETDQARAIRVGQWSMGYDSLVGTITQSVYRHLRKIGTGSLKLNPMSDTPSDTGVPKIGRISARDTTVAGCPVPHGSLVECYLNQPNSGTGRLGFFGAGAHLCLGRPLALEFYKMVSRQINACDFGLDIVSFRLRDCDVFTIPDEFVVRKVPSK